MFHISLARKCQLLFGLAVLLIVGAALFVPAHFMETFVHEMNFRRAKHLATLAHARVDPASPDWDRQQASLKQWWELNAEALDLRGVEPNLIVLPTADTARRAPAVAIQPLRKLTAQLSSFGRRLGRWISPPPKWQLAMAAWQALPGSFRQRLRSGGGMLLGKTAAALTAEVSAYPKLDDFQAECIREMQANDTVNERQTTMEAPDETPVYRCVLAVRRAGAAAGRRPLVGIVDVKLPVPGVDKALLASRLVVVSAGVLAGFLAILVFYLISQRLILAPVRELKALVERIAGGDLTARSTITTGDEFEELSNAFNDMLSQLDGSRAELEKINRSLDAKLGELAQTNVALYESNRLKSEFLANVSHELRTPLASIIGFADLLRDTAQDKSPVDTTRLARFAHNILTSGRELLDIINDLLDLAKIEAGKIELHRAPLSVRDLGEALADFMRPLIDKKGLTMTMDVPDELPMMNSDAGKIRQILYNLLSNAVKYTPEGGTVTLEAAVIDEGRRVRLVVTDTGPGIAPEDRERIFEKFRQLDASVTREHTGTGLGLAITRELCTMLGGTIRLESELGRGSRFIIELPIECPETPYRSLSVIT